MKRRRRGWQRADSWMAITDLTDMSLSQLQEMVKDGNAWGATVHGITSESDSSWATEQQIVECPSLSHKMLEINYFKNLKRWKVEGKDQILFLACKRKKRKTKVSMCVVCVYLCGFIGGLCLCISLGLTLLHLSFLIWASNSALRLISASLKEEYVQLCNFP